MNIIYVLKEETNYPKKLRKKLIKIEEMNLSFKESKEKQTIEGNNWKCSKLNMETETIKKSQTEGIQKWKM